MSKFTFTSSNEGHDHDEMDVNKHVFRRLGEGRESLKAVESTSRQKWHVLSSGIGDGWIAYEYLGTVEQVNAMLNGVMWDSIKDLPKQEMSLDAPRGVGEKEV